MNISKLCAAVLLLALGMGVGSIHNAQAREALPGPFTPMGGLLIGLTLLGFVAALYLWRYFSETGAVTRKTALALAVFIAVLEGLNLVTTLMSEGSVGGWLIHEYLGLLMAPVVLLLVLFGSDAKRAD